jgi:hypothetical protein
MTDPVSISLTATLRFTTAKNKEGVEVPAIGIRVPIPPNIFGFEQEISIKTNDGKNDEAQGCEIIGFYYTHQGRDWNLLISTGNMSEDLILHVAWVGPSEAGSTTEPTSYVADIPFSTGSPVNREATIELRPNTPVLSAMLIGPLLQSEAARMAAVTSTGGSAESVVSILQHVHDGLRRGLGELWAASAVSATKQGIALSDWDIDDPALQQPDLMEAWAQAITEHISPTVYQGAGMFLGCWSHPTAGGAEHDADAGFLMSVRNHLERSGELCVPLMFECQQLTSWVLFTSGYLDLTTYPVPGSIMSRIAHTDMLTFEGDVTVQTLKDHNALKPGTCIFKKINAGGIPHVGPIIRVPGEETFQMVDAGGWRAKPDNVAGNHDTKVVTRLGPKTEGFVVPTDPFPDPAQLRTFIKRLRSARPLGIAQLAIYMRGHENEQGLVWASRIVPMHELLDGSAPNSTPGAAPAAIPPAPNQVSYPLSRLMASLRGCPYSDELSVHWYVWAPQDSAGQKTEKNNNVAYVIRHGNGRTPDSRNLQFWWQEQRGGPTPTLPGEEPLAGAEDAPYGPRPINRIHVADIRGEADGIPTVSRGLNNWVTAAPPPAPPPFQLPRHPVFLATFANLSPSDAPPTAYPSCVDLRSVVGEIPAYFGGSRPATGTATLTPTASNSLDWQGSSAFELDEQPA